MEKEITVFELLEEIESPYRTRIENCFADYFLYFPRYYAAGGEKKAESLKRVPAAAVVAGLYSTGFDSIRNMSGLGKNSIHHIREAIKALGGEERIGNDLEAWLGQSAAVEVAQEPQPELDYKTKVYNEVWSECLYRAKFEVEKLRAKDVKRGRAAMDALRAENLRLMDHLKILESLLGAVRKDLGTTSMELYGARDELSDLRARMTPDLSVETDFGGVRFKSTPLIGQ